MQWKRFYHPFTESLAVDKYGSYPMKLFTDIPFGPYIVASKESCERIRRGMKKASKAQRNKLEVEQMSDICKKVEDYCYNWSEGEEVKIFFETRVLGVDVRVFYFDSPDVDDDGYESGDVVDVKTGETIGNVWRFINRQKELRIEDDLEGML